MKLRPFFIALLACAVLPSVARADDKAYSIKYERRAEVGEVYDIHSRVVIKVTPTSDAAKDHPAAKARETATELTGQFTVEAVDTSGSPSELALTVKKFTSDTDDDEIMEAGAKVRIKRGAAGFEATTGEENEAVDANVLAALERIFPKPTTADATDDDVYKSNKPRKVGDEWEADYDALENQVGGEGMQIDRKETKLKLKFKEIRPAGKEVNLVVEISGKARFTKFPELPNFTFKSASAITQITCIVPEDKTAKAADRTTEEVFNLSGTNAAGDVLSFKQEIHRNESVVRAKDAK